MPNTAVRCARPSSTWMVATRKPGVRAQNSVVARSMISCTTDASVTPTSSKPSRASRFSRFSDCSWLNTELATTYISAAKQPGMITIMPIGMLSL